MSEDDRLRALQVRIARHDRRLVFLGLVCEHRSKAFRQHRDLVDLVPELIEKLVAAPLDRVLKIEIEYSLVLCALLFRRPFAGRPGRDFRRSARGVLFCELLLFLFDLAEHLAER